MDYPLRDKHFAHKFTRILHKSCACQELGRDTVLLLILIAHTEDAARYSGPVKFWNSQLSETMGFTSPKQLNQARQRAIDAGWLAYAERATRSVGEYFVTIPGRLADLSDAPMFDPADESILSSRGTNDGMNGGKKPGTNGGTKRIGIAERIGDESRNEKDTNSGKLPIPIPNPSPSPPPSPTPSSRPDGPKEEEDSAAPSEISEADSWRSCVLTLSSLGVGTAADCVGKARRSGAGPRDVEAVIEHWRRSPGAWTPGLLGARVAACKPGLAVDAFWPPKARASAKTATPSAADVQAAEDYDAMRLVRDGRRVGKTDEQIQADLVRAKLGAASERLGWRQDGEIALHLTANRRLGISRTAAPATEKERP